MDRLDDPESGKAEHLNGGKEMNAPYRHVAQEHVVRLVLGWHEHDQDALDKLNSREPD